MQRNTLTHS